MVLCPDGMTHHDTMSEGDFVNAKKVASGGYLHLLQAHCPGHTVSFWRCGGCGAGTILVAAYATATRRTMRIRAMHQRGIVH